MNLIMYLVPETYFAEGYGEKLDGFDETILYQKILREFSKYPNTSVDHWNSIL